MYLSFSETKSTARSNQTISSTKMLAPLIEADEGSQMYNADEFDDDEESPPVDKEECHVISNMAISGFVNETEYKLKETQFNTLSQTDQKPSVPLFKVNGATVADKSSLKSVRAITKDSKKKNRFKLVSNSKPPKKREKNAARRERKATKTLAIVLGENLLNNHSLMI